MANTRYCIYCHTNKENGMKYVGCTGINPVNRWGLNGCGYDKNTAFGKAISEFGWDSFSHEILEYGILGVDEAYKKECEYIRKLNAVYPNGYNTEDGGIHGSVNPTSIYSVRRERRPKTGWHHSEETKEKMSSSQKRFRETHTIRNPRIAKPVDMFSKDGDYLRSFSGASEASRETGIAISTICKACKDTTGRNKTAGGYVWKYRKETFK